VATLNGIDESADDLVRCGWAGSGAMRAYHDTEWGVPERDGRRLFEYLVLEGAQAGLSWSTILDKREGYRSAFAAFDPVAVAAFGEADIERCLADPRIVRNRAKINSAVGNARAWLELDDPVTFVWDFVDGSPRVNAWTKMAEVPAATPESTAMSKELKRRGFRFVGPTICYAFMQSCGLVDDHLVSCFRRSPPS
jgi:DNA-3-methyladenine glycosylase I